MSLLRINVSSDSKVALIGLGQKLKTLYEISVDAVAWAYRKCPSELHIFPANMYFDVLYSMHCNDLHSELTAELTNLDKFTKALKATSKRIQLHKCFQAIMNRSFFSYSTRPSCIIAEVFVEKCTNQRLTPQCRDHLIFQGLSIASFLAEAGWLEEAESILLHCQRLLMDSNDPKDWFKLLECYHRLLHVQNGFCQFNEAEKTFQEATKLVSKLQTSGHSSNLALLYSEFSTLYMLRSDYSQAYYWSVKAIQHLVPNMFEHALVDVLRQAAKSCVLKREFKKAGLLIKQAFKIARGMTGEMNLKYADTLIDFGFYLLNVDKISQGIEVYQTALNIRQSVFGCSSMNLHVATAYEELSYASYVYNYSNGLFNEARNQVEMAIYLLLSLLPKDHLLLSSCKRVKALILEEMAIENTDKEVEAKYLEEAHNLHNEALHLALEAFGEMNVQTAKHYGNLGRLYQSMKQFKKAEEMHLKAIHIKEALLGPNDYEVALSVGYLASLYNYDLGYYKKAEILYLRSIDIGKKLFGEAYSGLEYDYRGLLRVYTNQCDMEKRFHYMNVLTEWKAMRKRLEKSTTSPFNESNEPPLTAVELTFQQFMTL